MINNDEIINYIKKISKIKNENIDKLKKYASLVIEYNKNVNITGAKDEETFFNEHILDSLTALDIFYDCDNIIDIGSGAGLPSIPLAIIYNNKKFTLCESKNKKANFLNIAKKELSLDNIDVKCINAYEIKEKYDIITSRAFSDISTLLKIFYKIKNKNAKLIAYKGKMEKIEEEINSAKQLKILKNNYNIEIKKLYSEDKERHIIIISNL